MHTNLDQNTHAELHHDLSQKWDDSDSYLQKREENSQKLWRGESYDCGLDSITLLMVFDEVLNRYDAECGLGEDGTEYEVLRYAMDYPESVWYKRIEEVIEEFVVYYED